jgi:hypothetical protein
LERPIAESANWKLALPKVISRNVPVKSAQATYSKYLVHESYERENKRKRSTEATVFIPLAFDRLTVEENTKILLEHIKMFRGKGVGPAVTAFGVV